MTSGRLFRLRQRGVIMLKRLSALADLGGVTGSSATGTRFLHALDLLKDFLLRHEPLPFQYGDQGRDLS
jgi:hypothetical protein